MANPKLATNVAPKVSALQLLAAALKQVNTSDDALTFDITTIAFNKTKSNVEMQMTASNGRQYIFFQSYRNIGLDWTSLFQETDNPNVLILAPDVRVSDTEDKDGFYAIYPPNTERVRNWTK